MLRTEAIKSFLKETGNDHLTLSYSLEMEVQVNVAQDEGHKVKGVYVGKRWTGWSDSTSVWKSFRIPYGSYSNPQYQDKEIRFDLAKHVEGIGMTGWNWVKKESVYVGFDFDSVVNHEKAGLEEEELQRIKDAVCQIPWVTLVKSTSGKGLHLYIHFESPVPTVTHTEHAALARAILSVLSAECGFNLDNSVDICGGVLWIFHRKQSGTDGLSLIKKGSLFSEDRIPKNWQEHIGVTCGKTKKVKKPVNPEFSLLISSQRQIALDEEHKRLLKWFCDNDARLRDWWWDSDYNMLICHTLDLVLIHKELSLRGFFYTDSSGSSTQNCFCFPGEEGSWTVRRHGIGTREHVSWSTDPSGWTRFTFNMAPEFEACIKIHDGVENAKGEYVLNTTEQGLKTLSDLGIRDITLEPMFIFRSMYIKEKGEGRLVVGFDAQDRDPAPKGWLLSSNSKRWERIVYYIRGKHEMYTPDHLIRHVISNGAEAGWYIRIEGEWVYQNKSNVSTVLVSESNKMDVEQMIGKSILAPWKLVNIPFEEEYLGNRKWNRDAATFSVEPEDGIFDTWLQVLNHCGKCLDPYILQDAWCQSNAIETGSDYLLVWIASMFQKPQEPLPYLFFVGDQNTGKSTLHESLSLLFKRNRGYVRADNALISQGGFNAELENAVLCVVEEVNLNKNKEANNRIKDWVTGKTLSIRALYKNAFDITNTTHWIQCANDVSYCPVLPGDTRVVVCNVEMPLEDIPKKILFERLEEEKASFLHRILTIELPLPEGRLGVPCIKTAEKEEIESYNQSDLQRFMAERISMAMGHYIPFDEFYETFQAWLPLDSRRWWSEIRTAKEFPKSKPYCKGKYGEQNKVYLGNISFDHKAEDKEFYYNFNPLNSRLITKEGEKNE